MDVASGSLAAALFVISNAMLPVPWWIIALAAIVFVCLIARIVSLIDERRRLKNEITALEGDEEKTDSTPDTKMGGAED